jgi:hypothetical protein
MGKGSMLVIIPCGGLTNRLMALMSAQVFAEHLGCPLQVVWRAQSYLNLSNYPSNYPISALFEGIDSVPLAEAEPGWGFNHHHHSPGPAPEVEAKLRAGETVFLHSYCFIEPEGMDRAEFTEKIHRQFEGLKPLPEVRARVPELPADTIGIQVRRGDSWRATRYSPIALFFRVMDWHCDDQPNLHFFLATDSPRVRREMKRRYSRRILTLESQTSSPAWLKAQAALVDILALTRTSRIYTSAMSSFGFVAHLMSRRPHFCVSLPNVPVGWHDSRLDKLHDRLMEWNQQACVWQRRALSDTPVLTRIQAYVFFCLNRFVCSNFFQLWPYHLIHQSAVLNRRR